MTREGSNFLHGWILPHIDLVLAIAMGRNKLIYILREHQIAYLTSCLNGLKTLEFVGVPEFDCPILSASSRSQKTLFVR